MRNTTGVAILSIHDARLLRHRPYNVAPEATRLILKLADAFGIARCFERTDRGNGADVLAFWRHRAGSEKCYVASRFALREFPLGRRTSARNCKNRYEKSA